MLFMPLLYNYLHACRLFQTAAPKLQVNVKLPSELSRMCETPTLCHHHEERTSRWLSPTLTPPASSSYKSTEPGVAPSVLLTLTWGDFVAILTISTLYGVSISTGLCKPPLRTRQAWLPLRNPWRWCPSSRGNASVIIYSAIEPISVFACFYVVQMYNFLETRKDEVCIIRSKFPNKLPVSCHSELWV